MFGKPQIKTTCLGFQILIELCLLRPNNNSVSSSGPCQMWDVQVYLARTELVPQQIIALYALALPEV